MSNNNQQERMYPSLPKLPSRPGIPDEIMNWARQAAAVWARAHNSADHYECAAMAYGFGILDMFEGFRKGMYDRYLRAHSSKPKLRWVKASERLPKYPGDPNNHYRIDGFHKVLGNFHYSIDDERCEGEIVFTVIGHGLHADYQIPKEKWSSLEWLDESPSPTVEPAVEREKKSDLLPHLGFGSPSSSNGMKESSNIEMLTQWIDAEDSLPHEQNEYHIRYRRDGEWVPITAFYDGDARQFYIIRENCHLEYLSPLEFKGIQWLYNSPADPEPSPNAQYVEEEEKEPFECARYNDGFIDERCDEQCIYCAHPHEPVTIASLQSQLLAANAEKETADKFNGSLIDQLRRELKAAHAEKQEYRRFLQSIRAAIGVGTLWLEAKELLEQYHSSSTPAVHDTTPVSDSYNPVPALVRIDGKEQWRLLVSVTGYTDAWNAVGVHGSDQVREKDIIRWLEPPKQL